MANLDRVTVWGFFGGALVYPMLKSFFFQLIKLLEAVPDNLLFSQYSTEIVGLLQNSSWILTNLSGNKPCFVTAESYVRMAFLLKGWYDYFFFSNKLTL